MKFKQVVVIGSSDDNKFYNEAFKIGEYIAKKGYVLITGGRTGIMEAASRGAFENNGTVIGILPGDNPDQANKYCNIVIPTGIGFARNIINILSADIVIAIGGKAGTLSELTYAWQYEKPVISCLFADGWSKKFPETLIEDRGSGKIYTARSVEDVFKYIDIYFNE